jgi:hypothetical protein
MEHDSDFRDWVVADVGVRLYVGKLDMNTEGFPVVDDFGFITLNEAFELLVVRSNQQTKDGKTAMMQEHMHVELPLCTGGEPIEIKPVGLRFFRHMSEVSKQAHIDFVMSARKSFEALRLMRSNIAPASPAEVASLGRSRA